MRPFKYARPSSLDEAVGLLQEHGPDAMLLAGGTDLVIGLREGWLRPEVVVDLKRIDEMPRGISHDDGMVTIGATVVMADLEASEFISEHFPALVEAAEVVGSVQIRNRATLAGNICNASPAADTAPPLLVYDALMVIAGPDGVREVAVDDFIQGPSKTDLKRGELVIAIKVPVPEKPYGAAYYRMTRRRGTDLASITLSCGVSKAGVVRLSYGSIGPRPFLVVDDSGELADRATSTERRDEILERMFDQASPSVRSMRASPEYRLAMVRVLGRRALNTALERLEAQADG